MENRLPRNLTIKHKLLLVLIFKVKSASTIYNIDSINRLFGVYIDDLIEVLKDLEKFGLVESINEKKDTPNRYKVSPKGNSLLYKYLPSFIEDVYEIIENRESFENIVVKSIHR